MGFSVPSLENGETCLGDAFADEFPMILIDYEEDNVYFSVVESKIWMETEVALKFAWGNENLNGDSMIESKEEAR